MLTLTPVFQVLDLDSDEDENDMDDPFEDMGKLSLKERQAKRKQRIAAAEEDWETESEDAMPMPPANLPECPNPDAEICYCMECTWWEQNTRAHLMPTLEDGVKRDGHA